MEYVPTSHGRTPTDGPRLTSALAATLVAAILMGGLVVFAEIQALVACVSLLACVFILLDFRFGVVCLILLMPLSATAVFPHSMAGVTGLNPLNLLLAFTLASLLLRGLGDGGLARFAPRPVVWLYLVPIVLAGLLGSRHAGEISADSIAGAISASVDSAGTYLTLFLLKPLSLVLFALMLGAAVARSRQPERFFIPMLASVWIISLLTIVYVWYSGASLAEVSSARERNFLSPLGLHANDMGRFYAVAYAVMLFMAAATRNYRLKVALSATIVIVVVALTLTFSRSAFLGFILVSVLFLLSRRKIGVVLLGGAALAALAWLAPEAVYDRISLGWGGDLNAISADRIDGIWLPLLPEVWRSPFYGNGLESTLWSEALRTGRIDAGHPHNAYLRALLDMGIIGLVLLGAYFVHVWKGFRCMQLDPSLSITQRGFFAGAAAGLLAFLITGFSGSSLTPGPEQFYLWFAIGMMYGQIGRPRPGAIGMATSRRSSWRG